MCLVKWFNNNFKRFVNGIQVSIKNAASEIYSEFNIYLMRMKAYDEVCISLYFAEWRLLLESLMGIKLIYHDMHACITCIKVKLKTTEISL